MQIPDEYLQKTEAPFLHPAPTQRKEAVPQGNTGPPITFMSACSEDSYPMPGEAADPAHGRSSGSETLPRDRGSPYEQKLLCSPPKNWVSLKQSMGKIKPKATLKNNGDLV